MPSSILDKTISTVLKWSVEYYKKLVYTIKGGNTNITLIHNKIEKTIMFLRNKKKKLVIKDDVTWERFFSTVSLLRSGGKVD